ncbi:MAG: DASH family cryptochrome [Bacteroidia bacterium]|nr:DASH family cryptochrome [Bacteroidia bacterium]
MKPRSAILWFRNDLRVHDHEPLTRALARAEQVIPVYCVDPGMYGKTAFGFPKTGPHRARFLLESLADLRLRLRQLGSELLVLHGKPEAVLPPLVQRFGASWVFAHQEVTSEETGTERRLEQALHGLPVSLELFWGHTLYHLADLDTPVQSLPEIFTQFRKQTERYVRIRPEFPAPAHIPTPALEATELPSLGLEAPQPDPRAVMAFAGGETAGLARLKSYLWEQDLLKTYKETRNGLLGADYSSKFSPWLALGCLSPRRIHAEVQRYEQQRVRNDSTYWLIFELIWRDYFRFIAKKHGNKLFQKAGIKDEGDPGWRVDWRVFDSWREGSTGFPFIDANLRELKRTGFMSNRGRQNAASFLVHDLGIDWRMGAEWFESQLIDYDPCSNWGNWNYVAGVGNDPREDRYFNIVSQAKRYDPKGEYIRTWVPELAQAPLPMLFEPHLASRQQWQRFGVELGVTYPNPVTALRERAH